VNVAALLARAVGIGQSPRRGQAAPLHSQLELASCYGDNACSGSCKVSSQACKDRDRRFHENDMCQIILN
ncbi:MAG TPA: hypothetical protein VN729_09110, partial [Ktedonobacteraceae bacterium]|nr:hypothetical protein [Ktedonobacteraceae bacterium]